MSKFFVEKYSGLVPYTPGEQPRDGQYIKLNTNESPFAPAQSVQQAAARASSMLNLYSDPESHDITAAIAARYGVRTSEVLVTNGSDEALNFAFMAFADEKRPLIFPDISYGFYPVFAELNRIPYRQIPLKEDFTIDVEDYLGLNKTIVIANPNAPTGLCLPAAAIEQILRANPEGLVIIDEAYVDFGGESVVPLISKYDNLLVVQTFSKSRSLAGARLGYAIGSAALIADLNTIKYSTNPYNVNRMTAQVGCAVLAEDEYYADSCKAIIKTREYTKAALRRLGLELLDSRTNFLFVRDKEMSGEALYLELRRRGILVRHFNKARISDYVRVTIGTQAQMEIFIDEISKMRGATV